MATDTTAPTQSDGEVIAHMLAGFGGGGARGRGVVRVGHWTDVRARTGVTVVLLPEGSIGSAEVRGGAPATREFDVLAPTATVTRLDAVVLSGGSAFGLGAVDGVVTGLAAAGRGFVTAGGVVPIVAGMSLFDLAVGSPHIRPGATEGALATAAVLGAAATPDTRDGAPATGAVGAGAVGAGAGATVSKWRGRDVAVPGGLVTATICEGGFTVTALVAANAFGDVIGQGPANLPWPNMVPSDLVGSSFGQNTTLGVIVTDAALTKSECLVLAQGAHDGYARAITPPHCRVDGDAVVAAATGTVPAASAEDPRRLGQVELLRWMAVRAAADALATRAEVAPAGPIPWIDPPV